MKIKKIGYSSFRIYSKRYEIVTDPLLSLDHGDNIGSNDADVVLMTEEKYLGEEDVLGAAGFDKLTPVNQDKVFEIVNPGDYEIGGVIIRRPMGTDFYVIDDKDIRVVYVGANSASIADQQLKDLGDVDILILPIGGVEGMVQYEKMQKLISTVDPSVLIPSQYDTERVEVEGVKTVDEFIKHFGYTNVDNETMLRVTKVKDIDSKMLKIVCLE